MTISVNVNLKSWKFGVKFFIIDPTLQVSKKDISGDKIRLYMISRNKLMGIFHPPSQLGVEFIQKFRSLQSNSTK